mmetsp:Transcript_63881/g.134484  ORF Transcript_63881/g.134484 Transcript_63881/m.134484 type:complete len:98 (+) Transcript_63881:71-364(+)
MDRSKIKSWQDASDCHSFEGDRSSECAEVGQASPNESHPCRGRRLHEGDEEGDEEKTGSKREGQKGTLGGGLSRWASVSLLICWLSIQDTTARPAEA